MNLLNLVKSRLGRKIFELMENKIRVSIHGLITYGWFNIRFLCISSKYSWLILFLLEEGRMDVHCYVIQNGMESLIPVLPIGNSLINMHSKCGSVAKAVSSDPQRPSFMEFEYYR